MDNQNKDIIKYIIKSAPIGHLSQTIENLKNLLGASSLDRKEITDEIMLYEEEHFKQLKIKDEKIVINPYNKEEGNIYEDQIRKVKIYPTPLSENIEKIEDIESVVECKLRDEIYKALEDYKNKNFKLDITAINGNISIISVHYKDLGNDSNRIIFVISAHNISHKSFWSGEWLSSWLLDYSNGKNDLTLRGTIKANTYYYEEGNIQFNLKTNFEEKLSFESTDEKTANEIILLVKSKEDKIQIDLDKVYENFSDNYVKPLRRKLPITGTKMNWNLNQLGMGNK